VDGGEGMLLWSCYQKISVSRPLCGRDELISQPTSQHENALQAGKNQIHQHKHVALVRLQAQGLQIWVFRISVSIRRF
jgi:hypothetical protein